MQQLHCNTVYTSLVKQLVTRHLTGYQLVEVSTSSRLVKNEQVVTSWWSIDALQSEIRLRLKFRFRRYNLDT